MKLEFATPDNRYAGRSAVTPAQDAKYRWTDAKPGRRSVHVLPDVRVRDEKGVALDKCGDCVIVHGHVAREDFELEHQCDVYSSEVITRGRTEMERVVKPSRETIWLKQVSRSLTLHSDVFGLGELISEYVTTDAGYAHVADFKPLDELLKTRRKARPLRL